MAYEFRALFTPTHVGRLTLKNRIYSSGHAEAMGENFGDPRAFIRRRLLRRGSGPLLSLPVEESGATKEIRL